MAPGLTLSFNDGTTTRTVRLEVFASFPRTYVGDSSLDFSNTGSALQSGATRPLRRIWSVVSYVETGVGFDLDDLFRAWDARRATGAAAVVSLTDETMLRPGAPAITAQTVFTDPLKIDPRGPRMVEVSFALTEV